MLDATKQRQIDSINKSQFLYNAMVGAGGFAQVYSACFSTTMHWVAVKEIKKTSLCKHRSGLNMLKNEIAALKRLNHPYSVPLHISFHDNKSLYFIFDLKLGGDLRHFLKCNVIFEEKDVAYLIACLSSALRHMHEHGVIHRDVKPENILIDELGCPYLADFGVSYVHESADVSVILNLEYGLVCDLASGTKQYLAPEVFTKLHIHGPESDFWSLGVVIYEMVYGHRPFKEHAPVEIIQHIYTAQRKQAVFIAEHEARKKEAAKTGIAYTDAYAGESVDARNYRKHRMIPQWDFTVNGVEPVSLAPHQCVPIPRESHMVGTVGKELRSIMKMFFEGRPTSRLGSLFYPADILSQPLCVKHGVNNERALMDKTIQPFFVPGRKFLITEEDNQVDIDENVVDPYLTARGLLTETNDAVSPLDEDFHEFRFISDGLVF